MKYVAKKSEKITHKYYISALSKIFALKDEEKTAVKVAFLLNFTVYFAVLREICFYFYTLCESN
jgi:hypothetical protein